jgi:hypothetical protein
MLLPVIDKLQRVGGAPGRDSRDALDMCGAAVAPVEGMSTKSETPRSAKRVQIPELVGQLAGGETTAELGSEGGSYGELTQSVRSREHAGDAVSERHGIWRLAFSALLALAILGVLVVALTFWLR